MSTDHEKISTLLNQVQKGDKQALGEILEESYDDLKQMAAS